MEHKPSLIGTHPADVLVHGPKKMYIDKYHWHSPQAGIVASYTPTDFDVEDHYGIFRGVDQIEAFVQGSCVSCMCYIETLKQNCTFDHLKQTLTPLFISIGQVNFRGYLQQGEAFISIGHINFYKFRQMTCSGRLYKVPKDLDLDEYFKDFTDERLLAYDIDERFELIAELSDITGRGIKKEKHT